MGEQSNGAPPSSQSGDKDKNLDKDCGNPNLKEEDFKTWLWCQQQEGEPPVTPSYTDEDGEEHVNTQVKVLGPDLLSNLGVNGLEEPKSINANSKDDSPTLQISSPGNKIDMPNDYLEDWAINANVPEIILSMEFKPAFDSANYANIVYKYIRNLRSARELRSENIKFLFEKLKAEGDDEVKKLVDKLDDKFEISFKHIQDRFKFYGELGSKFADVSARFDNMITNGNLKKQAKSWYKNSADAPKIIASLDDVDELFNSMGYANSIAPTDSTALGHQKWTNTKKLVQVASDLKNLAMGRSPYIFTANPDEQRQDWWDKIKIDPSFSMSPEINVFTGLYEYLGEPYDRDVTVGVGADDHVHAARSFHLSLPIASSGAGVDDKISYLLYLLTRELKFSQFLKFEKLVKGGKVPGKHRIDQLIKIRERWGLTTNNPLLELIGNIPENIFVPVEGKNRLTGLLIVDKDQYDNPESIVLPFESFRYQYYSDQKITPGKLHFYEYLVKEKSPKEDTYGFNLSRMSNYTNDIKQMTWDIEVLAELTFMHPGGSNWSPIDTGTIIRGIGTSFRRICKFGSYFYIKSINQLQDFWDEAQGDIPENKVTLASPKTLANMPAGLDGHMYTKDEDAISAASQFALIRFMLDNDMNIEVGERMYTALYEYAVLKDAYNLVVNNIPENPYYTPGTIDAEHIYQICWRWHGSDSNSGGPSTHQVKLAEYYNKHGVVEINAIAQILDSIAHRLCSVIHKQAGGSNFKNYFGAAIYNDDGIITIDGAATPGWSFAKGQFRWGTIDPNRAASWTCFFEEYSDSNQLVGTTKTNSTLDEFVDATFHHTRDNDVFGFMIGTLNTIMSEYDQHFGGDTSNFDIYPTENNGYARATLLLLVFESYLTAINGMPGGAEFGVEVRVKKAHVEPGAPAVLIQKKAYRDLVLIVGPWKMMGYSLTFHHISKLNVYAGASSFEDLDEDLDTGLDILSKQASGFPTWNIQTDPPEMKELYKTFSQAYRRDMKNTEIARNIARYMKVAQLQLYPGFDNDFNTIINKYSQKLLTTTSKHRLTNQSIILREFVTTTSPSQQFLSLLEFKRFQMMGIKKDSFYANQYKIGSGEFRALKSMLRSTGLKLGTSVDPVLEKGVNFREGKYGRPLRIMSIGIPAEYNLFYMSSQSTIDVPTLTTAPSQDNYGTVNAQNNFIKINVYRRDPEFPQIVFLPRSYIFDITRYVIKPWRYEPRVDDVKGESFAYSETGGVHPHGEQLRDEDLRHVKTWINRNEFNNPSTYSGGLSNKSAGPWQDFINDAEGRFDEAGVILDDRKRIIRNHCVSDLLGTYIKLLTSIDTSEGAFTDWQEGMEIAGLPGEYLTQEDYDDYRKLIAAYIKSKTGGATLQDVIGASGKSGKFLDQLLKLENATNTSFMGQLDYTVPGIPKAAAIELTEDLVSFINLFTPESVLNSGSGMSKRIFRPKLFGRIFNIIIDPDDFYIDPELSGFNNPKDNQAGYELINNKRFQNLLIGLEKTPSGGFNKNSFNRLKLKPKDPEEIYVSEFFVTISRITDEG